MRKFSSLEKEIIKKLVESPELNEQGMYLCSKFLEDNYIGKNFEMSLAVKCSDRSVALLIPKKEHNHEEFRREKILFVITFFYLIRDLQDERKIYLIGAEDSEGLLGHNYQEKVTFAPDLDLIICKSFFKLIAVSEELKQLVINDFRTFEEIQHEETIEIANLSLEESRKEIIISKESLIAARCSVSKATIAIWISVVLAITSISTSFYIANKQAENETKLNRKQFENLTNKIDSLNYNLS